jgi:hypothetical protein
MNAQDTVLTLRQKRPLDKWRLAAFAIAALVTFPLVVVLSSIFAPADDVWRHLAQTVLGVCSQHWLVRASPLELRCWAWGSRGSPRSASFPAAGSLTGP